MGEAETDNNNAAEELKAVDEEEWPDDMFAFSMMDNTAPET